MIISVKYIPCVGHASKFSVSDGKRAKVFPFARDGKRKAWEIAFADFCEFYKIRGNFFDGGTRAGVRIYVSDDRPVVNV
jgi:hypothetical protein